MTARKYVVITPVRNEAEFLPRTIECMAGQSVLPLQWVLINDGSTDDTPAILEAAARKHSWIRAIHRGDRGFRQAGGGVIAAFYDGYAAVTAADWEFLVKFDGDLSFARDYFEQCLSRFEHDQKLGIGGGTICNEVEGAQQSESRVDPAFHVRGATKIYRRKCWDALGGLILAPGWDTVDEVKANMLGWSSLTFPDIKLVHHRVAGAAYGQWSNWIKGGRAAYVSGYHPLFLLLKCCRRFVEKPYVVGACGLFIGFFSAYLTRVPKVPDAALIKYFRQQQMNRLLGRPSLWSPRESGPRDPDQVSAAQLTAID